MSYTFDTKEELMEFLIDFMAVKEAFIEMREKSEKYSKQTAVLRLYSNPKNMKALQDMVNELHSTGLETTVKITPNEIDCLLADVTMKS